MEKGSIVQVTDESSPWFACLVVVSELKSFGIQGYTAIPHKGNAYIRLTEGSYEHVGEAILVAE